MPETPAERSERCRRAAHIRWARTPVAQRAAVAELAARARYARRVDPDHLLPPDERAALIASARKAEMAERRWQQRKRQRLEGQATS